MGKRADFNTNSIAEIATQEKATLLGKHLKEYAQNHATGKQQYSNIALARKRAEHIRLKAIENLDKYLLEFESNCSRRGTKVLWAPEKQDALNEIEEILKTHKVRQIVKTKSSVAEEIGLRKVLEQKGFDVTETDVADAILKTTNDTPSHVIMPAIHKSHTDIAQSFLLDKAEGNPQTISETIEKITENTRSKYFQAQAAITGCNFLIANP